MASCHSLTPPQLSFACITKGEDGWQLSGSRSSDGRNSQEAPKQTEEKPEGPESNFRRLRLFLVASIPSRRTSETLTIQSPASYTKARRQGGVEGGFGGRTKSRKGVLSYKPRAFWGESAPSSKVDDVRERGGGLQVSPPLRFPSLIGRKRVDQSQMVGRRSARLLFSRRAPQKKKSMHRTWGEGTPTLVERFKRPLTSGTAS